MLLYVVYVLLFSERCIEKQFEKRPSRCRRQRQRMERIAKAEVLWVVVPLWIEPISIFSALLMRKNKNKSKKNENEVLSHRISYEGIDHSTYIWKVSYWFNISSL